MSKKKFKEPDNPVGTVAELFAGVGGFRIGLARAGEAITSGLFSFFLKNGDTCTPFAMEKLPNHWVNLGEVRIKPGSLARKIYN